MTSLKPLPPAQFWVSQRQEVNLPLQSSLWHTVGPRYTSISCIQVRGTVLVWQSWVIKDENCQQVFSPLIFCSIVFKTTSPFLSDLFTWKPTQFYYYRVLISTGIQIGPLHVHFQNDSLGVGKRAIKAGVMNSVIYYMGLFKKCRKKQFTCPSHVAMSLVSFEQNT